jgi:NADPH-dependent ferric siderophore reductase
MLVSLAVVLLSAAPGPVSLLASDAPALPAAARLLAQADLLTPPPLPPRAPDDEDLPEAEPPDLGPEDLDRRVRELDLRIQGLDLKWPGHAVVLMVTGLVLTSIALPMLPLLLLTDTLLLPIGVLAIAGVGVMVGGYIAGEAALSPVRAEHTRLLRERSRLKKERRRMKEQRDLGSAPLAAPPAFHVTLVSLAF